MGRWAQQHRRGGAGARSSGNCIQILSAQIESGDPQFVDFTFSAPVDDSDFAPGDFSNATNMDNATSLSNASPTVIVAVIAGGSTPGDEWLYNGTAPAVCTPQSGLMIS